MPQINLKQPGQPVADFSISGATVVVAGVSVDCVERQLDTAVTVEIRLTNGVAAEGDAGAYLAQIDIPARQYEILEIDEGSQEENTPVTHVRQPMPLDPNAVVVTLWPTA